MISIWRRGLGVLVMGVGLSLCAVQAAGQETWPFNPPEDKFSTDALLDLRSMNEPVAGETGLVRLSADGMSFVRGDGQAIRFWGANAGGQTTAEACDHQMRFLAKRGVN